MGIQNLANFGSGKSEKEVKIGLRKLLWWTWIDHPVPNACTDALKNKKSTYLPIYLSIHLSIYLCLSVYLSVSHISAGRYSSWTLNYERIVGGKTKKQNLSWCKFRVRSQKAGVSKTRWEGRKLSLLRGWDWSPLTKLRHIMRIGSLFSPCPIRPFFWLLYSVRGLERSELGGSHGCPGRLWDRFLWQVYTPSKASCLISFW